MTEEQKDFKKRNKWSGPHVGKDICPIFVYPPILHGSGHTVTMTFTLTTKLINHDSRAYGMILRNLACYDGYVAGGDICAGIELVHKMVHELSVLFIMFFLY